MGEDKLSYDESILHTVNKLIGGEENGDYFDMDLIVATNTAISMLTQLGVGPKGGFSVTGAKEKWSDFIGNDPRLSMVVTYVYLKVKLIFDPPASSTSKEIFENMCKEFEWRAMVAADPSVNEDGDDG